MKYTITLTPAHGAATCVEWNPASGLAFSPSASLGASDTQPGPSSATPSSQSGGSSNPAPDNLPPGCVLWGPDGDNLYEHRSVSGAYRYGNATGRWYTQVAGDRGIRNLAACLAAPPTTSPPDYSPVPPPSPVVKDCLTTDNRTPAVEQAPSANPPETPGSSGEPVNRHQKLKGTASYQLAEGWNDGAEDWRTYHTAQLSAIRAERDAMRNGLNEIFIKFDGPAHEIARRILALYGAPAKSEKGGAA